LFGALAIKAAVASETQHLVCDLEYKAKLAHARKPLDINSYFSGRNSCWGGNRTESALNLD